MAPAEGLSAPGSASYTSNSMTVGDGTWDFTKNTFLLPNLMGLDFETMRYNGMGNRFSTVAQYHSLITGHGVLAAITFLFLVPIAIMYVRFHPDRRRGRRIHAYIQVLSVGLATVVFILGFFAVGPSRNLTNPHHGIGVAIYVLILTQAIGGSIIRNIFKKSLRLMVHRWFGGIIGILGVVQIPLGLTLYGSPKYLFILYALWVGFLVLLYFILSWRHENDWDDNMTMYGGRSYGGRSESGVTHSEHKSKRGFGWLGPLAAGLGALVLLRGRKRDDGSRGDSPSHSGRTPEVVPSRRGSASYLTGGNEKYSERTERTEKQGGGLMSKLLAVGGAVGAGVLFKNLLSRKDKRGHDEEYSAVSPDTPSRRGPPRTRPHSKRPDEYTESEFTEDRTELTARPRTPLRSRSRDPVVTASGLSGPGPRPATPRASHARTAPSGVDSYMYSDYSSYVSPSRRAREEEHHSEPAKGFFAGLGLGWFAKKAKDYRDRRAGEERLRLEEERRDGRHGSAFTGDGYRSPVRPSRRRPPVGAPTTTVMSEDTESSYIEMRPAGTSLGGPPMPPLAAGKAPASGVRSRSRSRSRSRHDAEPVSMPPMPPDPQGLLHPLNQESGSESFLSKGGRPHRRHSSRRGRNPEQAAAEAAGSAAGLAAEEEQQRDRSRGSQPLSVVKVKYHDDRDRNVTLRRLTEEEARREQRRGRSASVSSLSGSETPGHRGYRRDGSARKTADEAEAERLVPEPLAPPLPAFAGGQRGGKDSAYYSGQPGPSGGSPLGGAPTISTIGSPDSHGTWSALSPSPSGPITNPNRPPGSVAASAAERRQRRRSERNRDGRPRTGTGTIDYN
ncbi:hypothetical protein F5Y14DRAFT_342219 [Nemania sp. NC0429]|nr:hypothetical protein F5Y14DRAFT_342219 [Nemania sp. NC0429]